MENVRILEAENVVQTGAHASGDPAEDECRAHDI